MPALRMVETPWLTRWVGRFLVLVFVATPFALVFLPWQQTVSGGGRVIAYHPLDRQYMVESPIPGRVMEFFVSEGDRVEEGDRVALVQDIDVEYLETLKLQGDLTLQQLQFAEDNVEALTNVRDQLISARLRRLEAQRAAIGVAEQTVEETNRLLDETSAYRAAFELRYNRFRNLYEKGLESRQNAELAERDYLEFMARERKVEAALESARITVTQRQAELSEVDATTQSQVQRARADLQSAEVDQRDLANQFQSLNVSIRRQETQYVYAPRSGTVLRLLTNVGPGAQVREGDPLATIVPYAPAMAAEVYLVGRDIPLVQVGDHVRLQFDGWPAVQFMGWPSVAVGTFGGRVAIVDTVDTHQGLFRILVLPDGEHPWPSQRFLRQGATARGWVLLQRVTLGFEVWRRINGFPPIISHEPPPGEGYPVNPKGDEKSKLKFKVPK